MMCHVDTWNHIHAADRLRRLPPPLQLPPLPAACCHRLHGVEKRVITRLPPATVHCSMVANRTARPARMAIALAGLLLVLQLPAGGRAAPGAYASDAEALLALKASFDNGDEVLTTWQAGTDACAWQGISCNTQRAVIIV